MEKTEDETATAGKVYKCALCDKKGSEDKLWKHLPKAHGHQPRSAETCTICEKRVKSYIEHMHLEHGPPSRQKKVEGLDANRPTAAFAYVICRNSEGKYLIVEENYGRGWWIPAGHVEPGETFQEGAIRECKEEAGVDIELKGLLKIQFSPFRLGGGRQNAFFYAEPKDPKQKPKSKPDYESRQAKWLTFEEISEMSKKHELRGNEAYVWTKYLENKGAIYPMDVFEGFRMMGY